MVMICLAMDETREDGKLGRCIMMLFQGRLQRMDRELHSLETGRKDLTNLLDIKLDGWWIATKRWTCMINKNSKPISPPCKALLSTAMESEQA